MVSGGGRPVLNLLFSTNVSFANTCNADNLYFLFAFFLICEILRLACLLYGFLLGDPLLQTLTPLVRLIGHALLWHHLDLPDVELLLLPRWGIHWILLLLLVARVEAEYLGLARIPLR